MRFATGPLTRHGHAGDTVIEQVLRIYLTIATEAEIATETLRRQFSTLFVELQNSRSSIAQ